MRVILANQKRRNILNEKQYICIYINTIVASTDCPLHDTKITRSLSMHPHMRH